MQIQQVWEDQELQMTVRLYQGEQLILQTIKVQDLWKYQMKDVPERFIIIIVTLREGQFLFWTSPSCLFNRIGTLTIQISQRYLLDQYWINKISVDQYWIQRKHCNALGFKDEQNGMSRNKRQIHLEDLSAPLESLLSILDGDLAESKHFIQYIWSYSNCFAMTLFGAKDSLLIDCKTNHSR